MRESRSYLQYKWKTITQWASCLETRGRCRQSHQMKSSREELSAAAASPRIWITPRSSSRCPIIHRPTHYIVPALGFITHIVGFLPVALVSSFKTQLPHLSGLLYITSVLTRHMYNHIIHRRFITKIYLKFVQSWLQLQSNWLTVFYGLLSCLCRGVWRVSSKNNI